MRFFIAFFCLLILTASSAFAGPFRNRGGCSNCSQAQPQVTYSYAQPQVTYSYAQPAFGYAQSCPCPSGSCVTGCVQGCPCPQGTVFAAPSVTYATPSGTFNPKASLFGPECKDGKCYLNSKPSVIPPNAMPLLK